MPDKTIIPTVLAYSKQEFTEWCEEVNKFFNSIHIDIIDSSYGKENWFDEIESFEITENFEKKRVHLMVQDPVTFLENKSDTLQKENVIYLIPVSKVKIDNIRKLLNLRFKLGIVFEPKDDTHINPEMLSKLKEVMFMGVVPGESGRDLEEGVFEKIKSFKENTKVEILSIPVSIDGGFKEEKVDDFFNSKADIIYANSYLKENGLENAVNKLKNFKKA